MTATKLTSFRLTQDDIDNLNTLKDQGFPSRTAALRWAIEQATKATPQLLTDSSPTSFVEPVPTIKLVSARGVAPPIQPGQTIKAKINGTTTTVTLDDCCTRIDQSHATNCPLKLLGYVDLVD